MANNFATTTLPTILNLLLPLAHALGVDTFKYTGKVEDAGAWLEAVGQQVEELGAAVRKAFEDGMLTGEEIQNMIVEAKDVPDAIARLKTPTPTAATKASTPKATA